MEIIFKTMAGSHLFGTNTENSDQDFKGVFIPSYKDILKPKTIDMISLGTGNDVSSNTKNDIDEDYYAVHKFFDMLERGDMNATEMLFAPNMAKHNFWWRVIANNKNKLISRECKGFVGYIRRQVTTYGARGDRLNEARGFLAFLYDIVDQYDMNSNDKINKLENFKELFQNFITQKQCKYTVVEYIESRDVPIYHVSCCTRKFPLSISFNNAFDIIQGIIDEYGHRAMAAASNVGIDWKAVSHGHRIGGEAIELLTTGHITFPRPNAAYLLDIKLGKVEYVKVSKELDDLLDVIENLKTSVLPEKVDTEYMNRLREAIYLDTVLMSHCGE